jgi:glycosyltransferase involved in cell wall biosynthesis
VPPRISIVIPNLNGGRTLARAIRSIIDQEYAHTQIILADGGSNDESVQVIDEYARHLDVVIQQRDHGQADGLNRGLRSATGEVRGWLCSDDELLPGALRHVASIFLAHAEVDVVAGASERVFGSEFRSITKVRPDAWEVVGLRNPFDQPSVFWRAAAQAASGELDTTYNLAFDWEFWCRLRRSGARLFITDQVLSRYHFSRTNKTSTGGSRHVEEGYRIIRRYGPANGMAAAAYRFLYEHFDLHGSMDDPPCASPARMLAYRGVRALLNIALGVPIVSEYNWHFASLQQRQFDWWAGERRLAGTEVFNPHL